MSKHRNTNQGITTFPYEAVQAGIYWARNRGVKTLYVDRLGDEPAIKAAAERSLADSVAQRLQGRYDQMLGKRFDGGVDDPALATPESAAIEGVA